MRTGAAGAGAAGAGWEKTAGRVGTAGDRPARLRPAPAAAQAPAAGPRTLAYALRWRPRGIRPGAHAGGGEGGEGAFRRHVELTRSPDPRRLDVLASLRDPFGTLHVRQYAPRRAIAVAALVDLSASMRFGGLVAGPVTELCTLLAASAQAIGDSFALHGAGAAPREDVDLPAGRRRGIETEVRSRLARAEPDGAGSAGLVAAAERLPARRGMVFLISDFLMPADEIGRLLDALWRHDVIPVVLHDSAAERDLPRWGLVQLADLETGARRLVVMRPALRARWRAAARARRAALDALFAAHGARAFHLVDRLDADALARHLLEG
ncbi:hypothetical protein MWN34_13655 [Ancylobacter sp. 6x-1]|uniref:DUF58 domain-containing protein n=1 Tax=Ancylobacter crimeensis TaxID=2579147 RepID=A0ABT0DDA9_9HYPH|nr:hypothetical protein [Ancylobacter crimeensis]MCK0197954.1 hypothetical protein [Ancylobacter crimeensis]